MVGPEWNQSGGPGPTREQLSTGAGGRRCARSPLSASTRSFQLAGAGGGCAVATWPDNFDVEGGKGDLVGRRVSRKVEAILNLKTDHGGEGEVVLLQP